MILVIDIVERERVSSIERVIAYYFLCEIAGSPTRRLESPAAPLLLTLNPGQVLVKAASRE